MAKKTVPKFDPRKYMEMAIEAMNKSIPEKRSDGKVSPKVGAVLVLPDNSIDISYRGELRLGDHAEFTVLERKNRHKDLTGSLLFATLEPCAPGARRHPKLGCAERIVNARIKEVWVGVADPDPDVDRKGITYLKSNGIIVHMFPRDLQARIKQANKEFFDQANERADGLMPEKKEIILSPLEKSENEFTLKDFSDDAIKAYLEKSKRNLKINSTDFWKHFEHIGMVKPLAPGSGVFVPSGFGLLLFGKSPRDRFPQAVVKAKVSYGNDEFSLQDFDQPLVLIPELIEEWLLKVLHSRISRDTFNRKTETDYPIKPIREAIINAIVHRDYDLAEGRIFIEIDDEKIVIRSAGKPVDPVTLDQVRAFEAPSVNRNPKVAYVFNRMGFMEEAELGMETFRNMQETFHLPSPLVDFKDPYLTLTFPRTPEAIRSVSSNKNLAQLNQEELAGYQFVQSRKTITKRDYVQYFKINDKKAQRHLGKMVKLKLIKSLGRNTGKYEIN